jgi:hypothetical protein
MVTPEKERRAPAKDDAPVQSLNQANPEYPSAGKRHALRRRYGVAYAFLKLRQQPFCAVCWFIEQQCSAIETAHELAQWNRGIR